MAYGALGGGTFLTQNKVLPGAYINYISVPRASNFFSDRGYATIGLELDWGATGGMAAPVLATYISRYYGLGVSLFIVTVAFSALLILLVGFDIPGKIYKLSVAK